MIAKVSTGGVSCLHGFYLRHVANTLKALVKVSVVGTEPVLVGETERGGWAGGERERVRDVKGGWDGTCHRSLQLNRRSTTSGDNSATKVVHMMYVSWCDASDEFGSRNPRGRQYHVQTCAELRHKGSKSNSTHGSK